MDFSFEKTNSAYMLFYERIEAKEEDAGGVAGRSPETCAAAATEKMDLDVKLEKVEVGGAGESTEKDTSEDQIMTEEGEKRVGESSQSSTEKPDKECDIVDKEGVVDAAEVDKAQESNNELKVGETTVRKDETVSEEVHVEAQKELPEVAEKKQKLDLDVRQTQEKEQEIERSSSSGICKELEDWIWQDNKNFLQDVNIFEHTYFK